MRETRSDGTEPPGPPERQTECPSCGPSSLTPRWNVIKFGLYALLILLAGFEGWIAAQPIEASEELVQAVAKEGRGILHDFFQFFIDYPWRAVAVLAAVVLIFGGYRMGRRRGG